MPIIQVSDIFKEKVDSAEKEFDNSIGAIFGEYNRGVPIHIGSCIFLSIGSDKYLITAAHIIDEKKNTTLYLGFHNSELIAIEGTFKITEDNRANRSNDKYDFAFLKLEEKFIAELGNVDYISIDRISTDDQYKKGRMYLAIGYPNSKNKSKSVNDKTIKSQKYYLRSTLSDNESEYAEIGVSKGSHILFKYDRDEPVDEKGNSIKGIHPRGMSGGGLFFISDPSNFEKFVNNEETPMLVGVLVEFHERHNLILATRISEILAHIE